MFLCLRKKSSNIIPRKHKSSPGLITFFSNTSKISWKEIIERNNITPLKSRIDAIQKLQPTSNKKQLQKFLGKLNFFSKYIYKMQLYLSSFYKILQNGQQNIRNDSKK